MKWATWVVMGSLIVGGITASPLQAGESDDSFNDYMKRDRAAFNRFQSGKQRTEDRAPEPAQVMLAVEPAPPAPAHTVSPQRQRAQELYDAYCRIGRTLDDPDPRKGYNQRISALRAKLFPTNRVWCDQAYWSEDDWAFKWPLLQDLEARAAQKRAEQETLVAAWKAEGFETLFHRSLNECYGRTTPYIYLDRADQTVFPSPIRTNMVDYTSFRMNELWPTNAPPAAPPPTSSHGPVVIHEEPPPPEPEPPQTETIDEELRDENIETVTPWDKMTPAERRRALMENQPEAWSGFSRDIFGTDTNGHARAEAAVTCSNVSAVATNIAIANLLPPTHVPPVKPWDQMTNEERHQALKDNRPEAWDAVRDALLSGEPDRLRDVLAALSTKPVIPEVARATAYWHGYHLGQMEAATHAEESTIDMVVAAYKLPELMTLVRAGYDDAKAGRPPTYAMPAPGDLEQLMAPPGSSPPVRP